MSARYLVVCLHTGALDGWYTELAEAEEVCDYRQSLGGAWCILQPAIKGRAIPANSPAFERARRQILGGAAQ